MKNLIKIMIVLTLLVTGCALSGSCETKCFRYSGSAIRGGQTIITVDCDQYHDFYINASKSCQDKIIEGVNK